MVQREGGMRGARTSDEFSGVRPRQRRRAGDDLPSVASTSIYHDWITLNGAWRLSFNFGGVPVRQESRIMHNRALTRRRSARDPIRTTCSGTCR